MLWYLEPRSQTRADHGIRIRMPYGDKRPQLVMSPSGQALATTAEHDGYDHDDLSVCTVLRC